MISRACGNPVLKKDYQSSGLSGPVYSCLPDSQMPAVSYLQ